ncbi:PA2169 family four-helix-bundle protein [Dyadobacter flavalbus]|uniref:PA2169 family four-helix-bundle protein n=1 Tax=Dyadobacter flavalbus TaxID=2579942 RepID=A0A5M8QSX3_9BACT|nr:PA2169 family four-helix-bundle protein [Dyadobacter flavalbus]KAA6439209.1 PA2169 family four-helix-bundle protein [Dyadobacter flavalbus]
MAYDSAVIDVLNDLILINNDRVAGYEKAYDETKEIETDLRALFKGLASNSRDFASDLKAEVTKLGGEPESGTMVSGKIYRAWMDIRSVFTNDNRRAVLENAETGEDAAKKAYEEALQSDQLPADIRQMVVNQQTSILAAHELIKKERDRQRNISHFPLTN